VARVNASRSPVAPRARPALYERLRETAAGLPGVTSAAVSPVTPTSGDWAFSAHVPSVKSVEEDDRNTFVNIVTPDWFRTYGTRLVAGRDFTHQDSASAPRVAIVNEAFVRHFIGERPATGLMIEYRDGSREGVPPTEIVGVVQDAIYRSLREQVPPIMYLPMSQRPNDLFTSVSLSVRSTTGNPAALIPSLSGAMSDVDPDLTFTFQSLRTQLDATLTHERILAMVSGFFGALALLLAACGLYGVTAYAVSRRRTEIGLRLALGARPAGILRMVLGRVAVVVLSGTVIGALVSMWLSRYVSTLIFGLTPHDPLILLGATGALLLVGMLAGFVPAQRAALLEPASVLREG
jgi:putative ABC transport system permease protein